MPAQFVSAFHGLVDAVRPTQHSVPIVTPIVCPPPRGTLGPPSDGTIGTVPRPAELVPGALTLTMMRALLPEQVAVRRAEGDTALHVIDGLRLSGLDDLPYGLHPNAAGFARMAQRFLLVAYGTNGCCGEGSKPYPRSATTTRARCSPAPGRSHDSSSPMFVGHCFR